MDATPLPRPGAASGFSRLFNHFSLFNFTYNQLSCWEFKEAGRYPKGTQADKCTLASVSPRKHTSPQFYAPRMIKCEDVFLFPHYGSSELENGGWKQLLLLLPVGSLLVARPFM